MIFYLGTHMENWLETPGRPLFVAIQRLRNRKKWPVAQRPWVMDSGGFTEVTAHGGFRASPRQYVAEVRRAIEEVGQLQWASPQDWMCEPAALARTGLTVAEHQRRTIDNFLTLRSIAPDLPFVPVLQGWLEADYLRHVEQYEAAGVDLAAEHTVGVGTVCKRQSTREAQHIVEWLSWHGLRLHGFGVKTNGLRRYGHLLQSADSLAWSKGARIRKIRLDGCTHDT